MTQPLVMSPESLGEKVTPLQAAGEDLLGQAQRAEITNPEIFTQAGDLMKVINTQIKKFDEARTSLVKPLNDHVKWINGEFKAKAASVNEAKAVLQNKMNTFAEAEAARIEAEAEAERKAAEEEALARAAAAEADGNAELAENIVDATADLPATVPKRAPSRGNFGTTSTVKTWKGDVEDLAALLHAIADGKMPEDIVSINQSSLDKMAKELKTENTVHGVRFYQKVSARTR